MVKRNLPANLAPAGLGQAEAAAYVGVSSNTFKKMVLAGLMPAPRGAFGRQLFLRKSIDEALRKLPAVGGDHPQEPSSTAGALADWD